MLKPIFLITGALGAGKTTAILHLLARQAEVETAVVVNEFGQIGIDGATLAGAEKSADQQQAGLGSSAGRAAAPIVREVPGGCVCCVASAELSRLLMALLQNAEIERVLVEPTGLAKTSQLVDMLRRPPFATLAELRPVIGLVDAQRFAKTRWAAVPYFHDQVEAAEVLVVNRCDLVDEATVQRCLQIARNLYPPKWQVITTSFGRLPAELFAPSAVGMTPVETIRRAGHGGLRSKQSSAPAPKRLVASRAGADHDSLLRHGLHRAPHDGSEAFSSFSWQWSAQRRFSAGRLKEVFTQWAAGAGEPLKVDRAKGLFQTDIGWMLLELAAGQVRQRPTHYRRDNRCDLIVNIRSEARADDAVRSDLRQRLKAALGACVLEQSEG